MQYMIDYGAPKGSGYEVTYGWFNLDSLANLCPDKNDYSQAIESKILVLDAIDRIKQDEKVDYLSSGARGRHRVRGQGRAQNRVSPAPFERYAEGDQERQPRAGSGTGQVPSADHG